MTHTINTSWTENMAFDAHVGNHIVITDAVAPIGNNKGASPKQLLLASLATCTGMDVVSLLKKMRVEFTAFRIDVEADLTEEHPRVYSEYRLTYHITGSGIDRDKVKKAVDLSQDTYCGVSAMLRKSGPIKYTIQYNDI